MYRKQGLSYKWHIKGVAAPTCCARTMLLTLCPDTVAGHENCVSEINAKISELQARKAELETRIYGEYRVKMNANQRVLGDVCDEFTRMLYQGTDPAQNADPMDYFLSTRHVWSGLGLETIQLNKAIADLREQKWLLEEEWRGLDAEIDLLKSRRELHEELISALGF